jgi:hypothetical protein
VPDQLSAADAARLMLNTPDLANRFVRVGKKKFPILHLGLGSLQRFRAAIGPLEEVYSQFANSNWPIKDFLEVYRREIVGMLKEAVPLAASICLGLSVEELKRLGSPVSLLNVVISQWVHNNEIAKVQQMFPHPDEDDEPQESDGNPMAIVERLQSAYHISEAEALSYTLPKIYMRGQSAAMSYKRAEDAAKKDDDDKPSSKPKGVSFEGKQYKSVNDMPQDIYLRYERVKMSGQ